MPERLHYLAVVPPGRAAVLQPDLVHEFLAALALRWRVGGSDDTVRKLAWRMRLTSLRGGGTVPPHAAYLLLSHHHLDKPDLIAAILRRHRARMVCLMHDLIPLDYPEYGRPGEDARHRVRVETVGKFADAIVAVSDTVRVAIGALLTRMQHPAAATKVHAVPHGCTRHVAVASTQAFGAALAGRPYFVCVGTIEPRKNHLMLLALWRRLVAEMGDAAPRLVLIGRRGWENENILDLLERCPALSEAVVEREGLPDEHLYPLLAGARALLFPSFAEGYGLPLAEALSQGVPAVCSDIDALREVGGAAPDYLDPLDGLGWRQAVLDYLPADSARRAAQLGRLGAWTMPSWDVSVSGMLAVIDALPAPPLGRPEKGRAEHPVP